MILRTTAAPLPPSDDYYVRLSGAELRALHLELQWTQWPAADDVESLGYAEWAGSLRGAVISLGCYLRFAADGTCDCSTPHDVSTNLMLVDARGRDAGPHDTTVALLDFVRGSLISAPAELRNGIQRQIASGGRLQ